MTDEQFKQVIAVLKSIDDRLYALAASGAQQELQTNMLFEALSAPVEEPTSVDPYFAQRLLRGADLDAG